MPAQSLSLPDELITELKHRAGQVPLSRYVTTLLRQALALPDPTTEARLRPKDAQVLWGIKRLRDKAKEQAEETNSLPASTWSLREIADSAGKYPSEARGSLRHLEEMGYVTLAASEGGEFFGFPPVDMCLPDGRLSPAKVRARAELQRQVRALMLQTGMPRPIVESALVWRDPDNIDEAATRARLFISGP